MADDLTNLSELNESDLIEALKTRYNKDKIYTCIGDILIALNPYKPLQIYGTEKWLEYTNIKSKEDHHPHIYMISDRAYQNIKRSNNNQCCVVSGESGAGKTESTKLLIEHIAHLCKHENSNLHEKIVEVNPLLEAFGNAQTVINNNSSRFGKFIELIFDKDGQIEGAMLSEYLLEKSRVVYHAPGEKNFHIFYYFFAGIDKAKLKANRLKAPEKHRIMMDIEGAVYENNEKLNKCKETWNKLLNVMKHVGFTEEEINGIEALLAVIVLMSDTIFVPHQETDGVSIKDDEDISLIAQLLGVNDENLIDALILSKNKVGSEDVVSLKNELQANDGRDALAKALYGRLFIWIVSKINGLLAPKHSSQSQRENCWIGILDIYGFENFKHNSFEQLCINVANEQLQLFFNEHIFKQELAEYSREGMPGNSVVFIDNQPLLDLFLEVRDPPGIFAILDEESKFPQASDQTFIDKLAKNFSEKSEFQSTKGQSLFFTIKHFAGPVMYNVDGFLEKNRDTLSDNITDCLANSDCLIVFELFSPLSCVAKKIKENEATVRVGRKGKRMSIMVAVGATLRQKKKLNSADQMKRASIRMKEGNIFQTASNVSGPASQRSAKTLATQFKGSLHGLIEKMVIAEPHFVRCIKPNAMKEGNNFNDEMLLQQLSYTGVLETVKIRKQGYSTRLLFTEFIHRYGFIGGVMSPKSDDCEADICKKILEHSKLSEWQIGKTKVFLRYWHLEKLNAALYSVSESIIRCQKFWKGVLARKHLRELKAKADEYKKAVESMNALALEVNERLYNTLRDNLNSKKEQQQVDGEEDALQATRKATVVEKRQPRKGDETPKLQSILKNLEPLLLPIWKPIMTASISDPINVFLQESLGKINSLQKDIWGKVYLMEKNAIIGKLYIRDQDVHMNDSNQIYTGTVIGVNSEAFDHLPNQQCKDVISQFGNGIQISKDTEGSISLTRLTKLSVHILGNHGNNSNCFSQEIDQLDNRKLGCEHKTKVFDMKLFKEKVASEFLASMKSEKIDVSTIAKWSVFHFSVGHIGNKETDLPLWVSIINLYALDLLGKEEVFEQFVNTGLLPLEAENYKDLWAQLNFTPSRNGIH